MRRKTVSRRTTGPQIPVTSYKVDTCWLHPTGQRQVHNSALKTGVVGKGGLWCEYSIKYVKTIPLSCGEILEKNPAILLMVNYSEVMMKQLVHRLYR